MTQLVEIKPLKPFVGSYRCALSEADLVDDGLDVNEAGQIIKVKVPRKRFVGLIAVQRKIRQTERELWTAGKLPANIEVLDENGTVVLEHPPQRTLMVPAEVASSLVSRELAEIVDKTATVRPARTKPAAAAA